MRASRHETAFYSTINKTPIMTFPIEKKVSHPSNRVPDTCRIYAKTHCSPSGSWWPNGLLRHNVVSFILAVACTSPSITFTLHFVHSIQVPGQLYACVVYSVILLRNRAAAGREYVLHIPRANSIMGNREWNAGDPLDRNAEE